MTPDHDARLQALLARFEGRWSDALRQRRQALAAGRAFMQRFQDLSQQLVWPLLNQVSDQLHAHGVATSLCGTYSYDQENSCQAEQVHLPVSVGKGIPEDLSRPVAGLCLSADGDSRQVRLSVRSLAHPEEERVTELPLLEQWTAESLQEEILAALEQVLVSRGGLANRTRAPFVRTSSEWAKAQSRRACRPARPPPPRRRGPRSTLSPVWLWPFLAGLLCGQAMPEPGRPATVPSHHAGKRLFRG